MMARRCGALAVLAVWVLTSDAGVLAQRAGVTQEGEVATAPVKMDGAELCRVRGVSSFPAEERAALIEQRLVSAAADPTIAVDLVRVVQSDDAIRIVAGGRPLMQVIEADAALEQVRPAELALALAVRFRHAIADYREARSASALQRAGVKALVATVVFAAAFTALLWFWRWIDGLLTRRLRLRIHSVGIQSFELMRAERIWEAVRGGLLTLRTLAFIALSLVYLGFVLSQFPWTRGLSRDWTSFALAPLQVIAAGIVAHIPSLVFLAVLFLLVRFGLRVTRLFFEAVAGSTVKLAGFDPEWAQPTYKIVRLAIVAFAVIVAYPYIPGSGSAAFKGVSVFIGILFSLGSSSAISNIIAGYMMTYRRAFKVGDRIKVGSAMGDVIQTRLQVTHLRSPKNEELVIPNSQILAGEVVNYSSLARQEGLILHTEVGIGYETPWRQVEAMLILAAERTSGLLMEPRPFVLQKKLGDFAVTYELNAHCRDVQKMLELYTELHRNILDVFNEYGVQIMTPAYEHDPAAPKVVAREEWYLAPAPTPKKPEQPARHPDLAVAPTVVSR